MHTIFLIFVGFVMLAWLFAVLFAINVFISLNERDKVNSKEKAGYARNFKVISTEEKTGADLFDYYK
jgi:hypothetical protein